MSLSRIVESPRHFDCAQGVLQAKIRSVMPAPDQSRGQAPAGIQGGDGATIAKTLTGLYDLKPATVARLKYILLPKKK
jgi:hypothetical protein